MIAEKKGFVSKRVTLLLCLLFAGMAQLNQAVYFYAQKGKYRCF